MTNSRFWQIFDGLALVVNGQVRLTTKGAAVLLPRLRAQGLCWPLSPSCDQAVALYRELQQREAWIQLRQMLQQAHRLSPENQAFLHAAVFGAAAATKKPSKKASHTTHLTLIPGEDGGTAKAR
jgi:hypothetical protein